MASALSTVRLALIAALLTACGSAEAPRTASAPSALSPREACRKNDRQACLVLADAVQLEESSSEQPATTAPPTTAAGFVLRQNARGARDVCEGHGGRWTRDPAEPQRAICAGADLPGAPGYEAHARFCDGELCTLQLIAVLREPPLEVKLDQLLHGQFQAVVRELGARFGAPTQSKWLVRKTCDETTVRFLACMRDARVVAQASWLWPRGERVQARWTPRADRHTVQVEVRYDAPRDSGAAPRPGL